jgi:putative Ca2+/H+ antiporter (TMEM165/GDT1 family)
LWKIVEDSLSMPTQSVAQLNAVVAEAPSAIATVGPSVGVATNPERAIASDSSCVSGQEAGCPPWRVFTTTFITIFLAELGDKTQVSTLLLSAQFHQPWVVFLGASVALIATTLIGVWVGQWLSSRLSPRTLDVAAGITLALIAVGLFWDVLHL